VDADRWSLLALPPLDASLLEALFADMPVTVNVPAERTPDAVTSALAEAEIVVGDWSGALTLSAAQVAAAKRLAFVQQPSVGVDSLDVDDPPFGRAAGGMTGGAVRRRQCRRPIEAEQKRD